MLTKKIWRNALLIFILTFIAYYLTALFLGGTGVEDSGYFDRLAYAFLQGEVAIGGANRHDLAYAPGHGWVVPFPPLPALLMLPWVAIAGTEQIDTILFSIIFGAINVTLVYLLLEGLFIRGWSRLNYHSNIWLTILFGFSTVHWYMSVQGSVWFVAQITTFTFATLALLLAVLKKHPILIGVAMGLAMLARPHIALMLPLVLWLVWQNLGDDGGEGKFGRFAQRTILLGIPMACAVALLVGYNFYRFGDPLDFGYTRQNVARELKDDLAEYGQFNTYYIERNARAFLWELPYREQTTGLPTPNVWGMSILLVTPTVIFLLWQWRKTWLFALTWLSTGLLLTLLLTYYNSGWWQFGYRFSLDFTPLLMILWAHTAPKPQLSRLFKLLIVVGIVVNLWGVVWFALATGHTLGIAGA